MILREMETMELPQVLFGAIQGYLTLLFLLTLVLAQVGLRNPCEGEKWALILQDP